MIRNALRAGLLGYQQKHVLSSGGVLNGTVYIHRAIMYVDAQAPNVQRRVLNCGSDTARQLPVDGRPHPALLKRVQERTQYGRKAARRFWWRGQQGWDGRHGFELSASAKGIPESKMYGFPGELEMEMPFVGSLKHFPRSCLLFPPYL